MRNRGLVLVEVLIAASLLLVLTGLLFAGWAKGVEAWRLVSERNELLTQAQRFVRLLEREASSSTASSLEIRESEPTCVSFASSFGLDEESQQFEADATTGALQWQKQVLVYHHEEEALIYRRELPIPADSPAFQKAQKISLIDFGGGVRNIHVYAEGGQPIARQVRRLEFELQGLHLLTRVSLSVDDERVVEVTSLTRLRN